MPGGPKREEAEESEGSLAVLEALGLTMPSAMSLDRATLPAGSRAEPNALPSSLGRFAVLRQIGRGGMGRVVEARDPDLRRDVAVKLLVDPSEVSPEQLTRFVVEAQVTAQLEHPNIVPVHELGLTADGEVFFVMKRVDGRSLRQVLRDLRSGDEATLRQWTRHRLLNAFVAVCNAVAYAHSRGVVHRDLKPENIMLGAFGEVLVMDWGVARLLGAEEDEETVADRPVDRPVDSAETTGTLQGETMGTPGYMSPEQARGELGSVDGRSDVWSLGAILYELLALQRAYRSNSIFALMFRAQQGPPDCPREALPARRIPQEIADIALKALAAAPEDRYASAQELAEAVEAFLEGSRRREAASRRVAEAQELWQRYRALLTERDTLTERRRQLEHSLEPWLPLEDKAELLAVRDRLAEVARERVDRFEAVVTACEHALSQDPGNPGARAFLARIHYARFEEAEAAGLAEDRQHHASRVLRYDDGRYAPLLQGVGSVALTSDSEGAEVLCQRFERRGLIWALGEPRPMGRTPIDEPLEMGSYLLTLRAEGRQDVRYPVLITRGRRWEAAEPIPLYTPAQVGDGWCQVPPGPFVCGGDPEVQDALPLGEPELSGLFVATFPVTMAEYCDFINHLHETDPEEAWSRVPRTESSRKGSSAGECWERPGPRQRYVVPEVDRDGDRWETDWAIFGVNWHDALAFAAWRTEQTGVTHRLPLEAEWEKAARGVDGRAFPWGDSFDATLCRCHDSRPGRPQPESVGSYPTDVSVYGVRDMAGTSREWCGDADFNGDGQRRPVRGGSWYSMPTVCRCASRFANEPWVVYTTHGFRLVRDEPLPDR